MVVPESTLKALEHYNKGLQLYKTRKFNEAIEEFQEAIRLKPQDGPSLLYIERCENFLKNPPPPDWDGVYTMTTK